MSPATNPSSNDPPTPDISSTSFSRAVYISGFGLLLGKETQLQRKSHFVALQNCPSCGAKNAGKYCTECGASIGIAACSKCGAKLSTSARFCHSCGKPTAPRTNPRDSAKFLWALVGTAAVIVVLVVVAVRLPAGSSSGAGLTGTRAPDLSSMSPREQADRLFNVVMTAVELGDTAQKGFHAPMALAAYGLLDSLDADGQYHVGLLLGAVGDHEGATAMADTLQAEVPGHLLAITIRFAAAEARGDSAAMILAYRQFLQHHEAEVAVDRYEYVAHRQTIDAFLVKASRALAETSN